MAEKARDKEKLDLILRDTLAIERTRLANQRTFLAFFRTGLALVVTALAIFEFKHDDIWYIRVAYGLAIFGGIVIIAGIINYFIIRHRIINNYYNNHVNDEKKDE